MKRQSPAAQPSETQEQTSPVNAAQEADSPDQIRKREEWFYKQRSSVNGRIPAGARLKAFQHMQRMMEAEGKLVRRYDGSYKAVSPEAAVVPQGAVTSSWRPIGPAPTAGGFFSPVTGRVTTIAVDPSDPTGNTVLIGGAQGGIWHSADAGATWTAVGDSNPSLAMGSIAFANPSSPGGAGVVYAGTGEQASVGFDVYYGAGVLKSTDHGQTWTQTCTVPGPTCPFIGPYSAFTFGFYSDGGARISYVAVNPSNRDLVLVGAQIPQPDTSETVGGVFCSDDGGSTWSSIPAASGEMATFVGFANATTAYAALGRTSGSLTGANPNGIYKSTNADGGLTKKCGAITFSNLTANDVAGFPATSFGRIDLGIGAADPTGNTVYASIADASIDPLTGRSRASRSNLGAFKTIDGGNTWTNTNAPDVCSRQCWYDNVIKVDPSNSNIVFFGGGAHVAFNGSSLIFEWLIRSTDGGTTWNPAIPTPGDPGLPHVDEHAMAFVKVGSAVRLYLGNDGGVWRTDDAEAATVTWTNLNNAPLQLTQFYPSLSIHPSNPSVAFAGAQDNGSQNYTGSLTWTDNRSCGDGGWTLIDPVTPSTVYHLCQLISIEKSVTNGTPRSFRPARTGIDLADPVNFIAPMAIDPANPLRLYFGTSNIYQTVDGANSWQVLSSGAPFIGPNGVITSLAVGGGNNGNLIYAGYSNGQVLAATLLAPGQGSFNIVGQNQLPPRYPTQIVVDPSDSTGNTLYVTYSGFSGFNGDLRGHIFKTISGGSTWIDVSCAATTTDCSKPATATGDLPDIPVNDLVIDPDLPGTLYAATDLGVFQGACTAAGCTWTTLSNSLPNVAVLSLRLHEPSRTLHAATHGRGVWDLSLGGVPPFAITGLSPVSANAGDPGLNPLTVNGNGFTANSQVMFTISGTTTQLATAFVSATQLNAAVPAAQLQAQGVAQVSVTNSGLTTNALPFPLLALLPTVASINPDSTPVQTPNQTTAVPIILTGTGFTAGSTVILNPSYDGPGGKINLATSFNSGNGQLTTTIPPNLLGPFGSTNDIAVSTPPPGGGLSAAQTFKVLSPVPPNDNFANAIDLASITSPDVQDTSAATTEPTDPAPPCGQLAGPGPISLTFGNSNTIWYKFTPTTRGILNLDLGGSSYVAWLSLWTGASQSALAPVPNACSGIVIRSLGFPVQLSNLTLTGGTTYYIMVGSAGPISAPGVSILGPPIVPNPLAFGGKSVLSFSFIPLPDFLITTSGATSQTVAAGQTATFTNAITVAALNGFAAQVNLSCSLPVAATATTCTPTPNMLASGSGTATVKVTTTTRGLMPPSLPTGRFYLRPQWVPLFLLTLLLALVFLRFTRTRRQRLTGALPLAVLVLFLLLQAIGCGGGGGGYTPPPPPTGTPAGTYTVTVTGTSGSTTHMTTLTLTVN